MKRLTKTYKDGTHGVSDEWEDRENSYAYKDALIESVGQYEDLELTPEQIREIDRLYASKCKEVAELQEKIEELNLEYNLKSDILKRVERSNVDFIDEIMMFRGKIADGKLIELPCKLGTNVYLLNTLGNKENWRVYKRKVSKFVYQQYRCKRIEVHFEEGRGYTLDGAFGDTVFLSRKEAEQALKRMKGE